MQIIVLGAGAIGSLYGAKLAPANDVTLIARTEHARAINAEGLRIEGVDPEVVRLRAATQVDTIERNALILVTTKVPATATALKPLIRLLHPDTTILCIQNGLGAERVARDVIAGRALVLRGITQFGAIFERPGTIRFMFRGYTLIEQHDRSARLAEVFNAAGLDCRVSPNIAADVWRKTIYNCVVNPITTITGSEVGTIADPRLEPLKRLVIDECLAVAAAEGIRFETDFNQEINDVFSTSHNLVSTLQDIRRGRPTEIDYLNGAVAHRGAEKGIPCPVNAALTSVIKAMEIRTPTSPLT